MPTGGYAYDRRVMAECRALGCEVTPLALPDGFPSPTPETLTTSARLLQALPSGQPVLIDGLAFGVLPSAMLAGLGRPLAALVHHPLALETGLDADRQARLRASERAALSHAEAVIVTSPMTARILAADYAVDLAKLVVALPGVEPAARARGTVTPPRLLAVGSIIPRKAYDVLVAALAPLRERDWRCHIVGADDRDPEAAKGLRAQIAAAGLEGRIVLTGAISGTALEAEYDAADLFVCASLFEGYGMVLTEAVARGLPVVATRAGAIPETVPAGAARLVPPGDAGALSATIALLLEQPPLRRALADKAWGQAALLPRWSQTAGVIAATMGSLAA
nr:glycosyltransferase family 4 protein [Ancylobacter koreensis]